MTTGIRWSVDSTWCAIAVEYLKLSSCKLEQTTAVVLNGAILPPAFPWGHLAKSRTILLIMTGVGWEEGSGVFAN